MLAFIYIYICMYIYIYKYIYIYTCIHICIYTYIYVYVCTYIFYLYYPWMFVYKSDTPLIDHLVMREFVSRPPSCMHRRVRDRKPRIRESSWAFCGSRTEFFEKRQFLGSWFDRKKPPPPRKFPIYLFPDPGGGFFRSDSCFQVPRVWGASSLLKLNITCTCFVYTVTDVYSNPPVKSPLELMGSLLQPISYWRSRGNFYHPASTPSQRSTLTYITADDHLVARSLAIQPGEHLRAFQGFCSQFCEHLRRAFSFC